MFHLHVKNIQTQIDGYFHISTTLFYQLLTQRQNTCSCRSIVAYQPFCDKGCCCCCYTTTPPPTCSFCRANHTRLGLKPLSHARTGINGISERTYQLVRKRQSSNVKISPTFYEQLQSHYINIELIDIEMTTYKIKFVFTFVLCLFGCKLVKLSIKY